MIRYSWSSSYKREHRSTPPANIFMYVPSRLFLIFSVSEHPVSFAVWLTDPFSLRQVKTMRLAGGDTSIEKRLRSVFVFRLSRTLLDYHPSLFSRSYLSDISPYCSATSTVEPLLTLKCGFRKEERMFLARGGYSRSTGRERKVAMGGMRT